MSERLLEFAREVLLARECLAEVGPDGALEAVLTPDCAAALGAGELVRFVSGSPECPPGAIPLSLGVETTERFSTLMSDRGSAAEFFTGPLYLKREGLGKRVLERLSSHNAALKLGEPEEAAISWIRLSYRWTAVSEEKREGIVEGVFNELTGASVPELLGRWDDLPVAGGPAPPVERLPEALLARRAQAFLERKAQAEIEPLRASLRRRLERDARRASDYYGGIVRQIRRKIDRRGFRGEEPQSDLERIRATEGERDRKLAALVDRYTLSVRLRPIAAERVIAPSMLLPLTVVRKDRTRRLALAWNPIMKELEPLPCDGCGKGSFCFSACREAVHLLCDRCFPRCPECGKAICLACRPAGFCCRKS